ncbi:MAG: hypothetical protein NZ821_09480, partial [Gloeomargarita sp. SKYB31]|nr:hypothetical protein [Gloeomargarita sp. SKYB31]
MWYNTHCTSTLPIPPPRPRRAGGNRRAGARRCADPAEGAASGASPAEARPALPCGPRRWDGISAPFATTRVGGGAESLAAGRGEKLGERRWTSAAPPTPTNCP